jgi:hypothetical protein
VNLFAASVSHGALEESMDDPISRLELVTREIDRVFGGVPKSSCSPRPRPGLPVAEITFAAQCRRGRGFATVSL